MEDGGILEVKEGNPCQDGEGGFQEGEQIVLWLHKMLLKMQVDLVSMTGLRKGLKEGMWVLGGRWRSGGTLGMDFVLGETLIAALKAIAIELWEIENKVGLVEMGTLSALSRASHHWERKV